MSTPFPIAYFGSVAYFQTLCAQSQVVFEQHEHFPKQTFRNRIQIRDAQGLQTLTLPVERPNGSKTATKDIRISFQQDWQKNHWRAIQTAYAGAPYFEHYADDIYGLIFKKHDFLIELHESILQFLNEHLQLNLSWTWSESFLPIAQNDFRIDDFEKVNLKGKYTQVIFPNTPFINNVSILDALLCEGPLTRNLLFDF